MFGSLSFSEIIALLRAQQEARAQALVDELSFESLIVRTGDDVTGGSDFGGNIINVTQVDGEAVIEGDVPENAELEVAVGGVAQPVAPAVPVAAEEPVVEQPVVVEEPAVVEDAPVSNAQQSGVVITPNDDGGVTIVGDVPDNAELVASQGGGGAPAGGAPGVTIIETVISEQINRNPVPEPVDGLVLEGGEGRDSFRGSADNDVLNGNGGNDRLTGLDGNDVLAGGAGRDVLDGGNGNDTFIFNEGDGRDSIRNFDLLGDDVLQLNIDGINSVDDFLGTLTSVRDAGSAVSATFNFGGGDSLSIVLESVESLTSEDFVFL